MMDCKNLLLLWVTVLLAMYVINIEGRSKKVVIHVPYKVKKVNHVHTIYKTIHHHHTHRDPYTEFTISPVEEHEHFHHLHIHDDVLSSHHNKLVQEVGVPEFLPDIDLEIPLKVPDIPLEAPTVPVRHSIPLYRRNHYGK